MNKKDIVGGSFPWDGHSGLLSLSISPLVTPSKTVQEPFPISYPDQVQFSSTLSHDEKAKPWKKAIAESPLGRLLTPQ